MSRKRPLTEDKLVAAPWEEESDEAITMDMSDKDSDDFLNDDDNIEDYEIADETEPSVAVTPWQWWEPHRSISKHCLNWSDCGQQHFSFTGKSSMDPTVSGILALAKPVKNFSLFLTHKIVEIMVNKTNLQRKSLRIRLTFLRRHGYIYGHQPM